MLNIVVCIEIDTECFNTGTSNVIINNTEYKSMPEASIKYSKTSSGLSSDEFVLTILFSKLITHQMAEDRFFDDKNIKCFYYDLDSSQQFSTKTGLVSKINLLDSYCDVYVKNSLSLFKKQACEVFSETCRASFCDNRCKINKENYKKIGVVTEILSKSSFFDDSLENGVTDYDDGVIFFTNYGFYKIKTVSSNVINLLEDFKIIPEIGESYTLYQGCDKKFSTCVDRFNNAINFRGEPFVY